jgi:hypothetical protein
MIARTETILNFYKVTAVPMMVYSYDPEFKDVSYKPAKTNRSRTYEILLLVAEYGISDGIHNQDTREKLNIFSII